MDCTNVKSLLSLYFTDGLMDYGLWWWKEPWMFRWNLLWVLRGLRLLRLNPPMLLWMWFGLSLGCEFNWLNHRVHTAVVTWKQQLISSPVPQPPRPPHARLLTKQLITLHMPQTSQGRQVEMRGAQFSFTDLANKCHYTARIEWDTHSVVIMCKESTPLNAFVSMLVFLCWCLCPPSPTPLTL